MTTLHSMSGYGADSLTLPAGFTGSGSAGFQTTVAAARLRMVTGTTGSRQDTARITLDDATVNAAVDLSAKTQFDFGQGTVAGTFQDEQLAFFIRAANDWANGVSPSRYVRVTIDTAGAMTLSYRNAAGTNTDIVLDTASVQQPLVPGTSCYAMVQADGFDLRAKCWSNNYLEPTTGGPNGDGWDLVGTMPNNSDAVTAAGRVGWRVLGAAAAGVAAYVGVRNDLIETVDFSSPPVIGGGGTITSGIRPYTRRARRR